MMLAHVPTTLENTRKPKIEASVRNVEIDYTWYWLDKALRWQWTKGVKRREAECLSNVGDRGDDAVALSWSSQGIDFDIVDFRSLMVVIRMQAGIKESILDAFKKFVPFDGTANDHLIKLNSELIGNEGDRISWGKIHVDDRPATDWYDSPIEWYRIENTLIFVYDKSLVPIRWSDKAENQFGGAGIDDLTPYLRFENSNRRERAELRRQQLNPDPLGKGVGLPVWVPVGVEPKHMQPNIIDEFPVQMAPPK
jgi:hypothetical protein